MTFLHLPASIGRKNTHVLILYYRNKQNSVIKCKYHSVTLYYLNRPCKHLSHLKPLLHYATCLVTCKRNCKLSPNIFVARSIAQSRIGVLFFATIAATHFSRRCTCRVISQYLSQYYSRSSCMKCCTVLHRANVSQITSDHATPIRAVARALIGGGGWGVGWEVVNIHVFVLCPTNFF